MKVSVHAVKVILRWGEHNNPAKVLNPSKRIKDNVDHTLH